MKVVIPQIAWHARDPVLTIDFDPRGKTEEGYYRLVTGGADKLLLVNKTVTSCLLLHLKK